MGCIMGEEKTIIAASKIGSQNRVYFKKSLLKALGVKKNDDLIFLRVGKIKPARGAILVAKLEDKIKK